MAKLPGGWIPIRKDLLDDRDTGRIANHLNLPVEHVVGLLVRFWSWIDTHEKDAGWIDGMTRSEVDRYAREVHFCEALESVGWAEVDDEGVGFPGLDQWLGETAKKRLQANRRQESSRAKRDTRCDRSVTESRQERDRKCDRSVTPSMSMSMSLSDSSSVSSSERFEHKSTVADIWNALPANRRKCRTRFGDAVILALRGWVGDTRGTGIEADTIKAALVSYYASHEGSGQYARAAHTLVADHVWEEPPEAWQEPDDPPPPGQAEIDALIAKYEAEEA
jgi:hypothetical protein